MSQTLDKFHLRLVPSIKYLLLCFGSSTTGFPIEFAWNNQINFFFLKPELCTPNPTNCLNFEFWKWCTKMKSFEKWVEWMSWMAYRVHQTLDVHDLGMDMMAEIVIDLQKALDDWKMIIIYLKPVFLDEQYSIQCK